MAIELIRNKDLSELNTFGMKVKSFSFCEVSSLDDVRELQKTGKLSEMPHLVLGGGSNILFTTDFEGIIIHNNIKGFELIKEDENKRLIKVGAGENWHELVMNSVEKGWGGIQNLSLIPGSAGAAPIQNIGAYGVELKDVFVSLEWMNLEDGTIKTFDSADCEFGYRNSIFKNELKGKGIVLSITLRLEADHRPDMSYAALSNYLEERGFTDPGIKDVSDAVIAIRQSKLPDPAVIGNAGSFFKNPVISQKHYRRLKDNFKDIPGYPDKEDSVKVPAGWLIDQAGWKGFRKGDIGVHDKQALVLVNYGGGEGRQLKQLATDIKKSVYENFEIGLETEVNII